MQGYCVRCKIKQEMLSATRTLMRNGRRAMIGLCACCGTKMSIAGVWDAEPPPTPTAPQAPPRALSAVPPPPASAA